MQRNNYSDHFLESASAEEALNYLYDQYSATVYGIAHRMLVSTSDAEDVTQEVFVKVWRNWTRFDLDKGSVLSWIMTISRRTIYDKLRSQQSRQRHIRPQSISIFESSGQTSISEEGIDVSDHVQSLDSHLSTIIDLLYFAGHTQAEASKILGIPLGTIKSRTRKALKQLRDIYLSKDLESLAVVFGLQILGLWMI